MQRFFASVLINKHKLPSNACVHDRYVGVPANGPQLLGRSAPLLLPLGQPVLTDQLLCCGALEKSYHSPKEFDSVLKVAPGIQTRQPAGQRSARSVGGGGAEFRFLPSLRGPTGAPLPLSLFP